MKKQAAQVMNVGAERREHKIVGLSPRVVILLVICAIFASWVQIGSPFYGVGYIGDVDTTGLPSAVGFFVLILLSLAAFKLKRIAKFFKLDLAPSELMVIYICTGFMYMLAGGHFIFNVISSLSLFAFESSWRPDAFRHADNISRLLFPRDEAALDGIMFGGSTVPWIIWLRPLVLWAVFYGAIFFLLFVIGALLYSRWNDVERLPFPLVTPIVTVIEGISGTADERYTFKNKVFLIGLIIPVVIQGLYNLHQFYPVIPTIPIEFNLSDYVSEGPLAVSLGIWPGTHVKLYPYAVGIGYLVPTDFSFSIWFSYYVFQKLILNLTLINLGIPIDGHIYNMQFAGGFMIYGIILLWLSRNSLRRLIRAVLGKIPDDPHQEPINAKLAVFGSIIAVLLIITFGNILLGVQLPMMVFYVFTIVTLAISHGRFRAEPGLPFVVMAPKSDQILSYAFGSNIVSQQSRAGIIFIDWWTVWATPSTSAWIMEGLKMADESGMERRTMMKAFGISIVLVFVIMFPMALKAFYREGLAVGVGSHTGQLIPSMIISAPQSLQPMRLGVTFWLMGAGITWLCSFMRMRYLWWPLHPWGYLLGQEQGTYFRFPGAFFLAWLLKSMTLRWFGRNGFETLKPLFIALIISDVGMKVLNALIQSIVILRA